MSGLTHFDGEGRAVMVDVSAKEVTDRLAVARASVLMARSTLALIAAGRAAKGDALGVARIAGIMAAKQTASLIPLCHPLALTAVTVDFNLDDVLPAVHITASCRVTAATGVEMEALTACTVAALTVYDMVKSVDRGIRITDVRLVEKAGGESGPFQQD